MAKETLSAVASLYEYQINLDGFSISEIPCARLLSISYSPSYSKQVAELLSDTWAIELPDVGFRTEGRNSSSDHPARSLLGLQQDQAWLLSAASDTDVSASRVKQSQMSLWLTDQSDAWAMLDINGPRSLHVLERLCPLDLNVQSFSVDKVARTTMEHMSVIIMRVTEERFYLLTPRSSMRSFVHALTHAATHVVNESAIRMPS